MGKLRAVSNADQILKETVVLCARFNPNLNHIIPIGLFVCNVKKMCTMRNFLENDFGISVCWINCMGYRLITKCFFLMKDNGRIFICTYSCPELMDFLNNRFHICHFNFINPACYRYAGKCFLKGGFKIWVAL